MVEDCLFCQIIAGKIPSKKVYEDDNVYAFEDIHPMAKTHWLFIHKNHTKDISEMAASPEQLEQLFGAITKVAKAEGLDQTGYRVVTNLGTNGGQTVFHTHFHVLGGERLGRFGA